MMAKNFKKNDEAELSAWQVEKIREGIAIYRIKNTVDGVRPSLLRVANDIECSFPNNNADKNVKKGEKQDKYFTIRQESLRRFMKGNTKKLKSKKDAEEQQKKFKILKEFLIGEKIFSEEYFLKNDELHDFIGVVRYFKDLSLFDPSIEFERKKYISTLRLSNGKINEIHLQFVADPCGHFLRVVETIPSHTDTMYEFPDALLAKDGGKNIHGKRHGYGFFLGDDEALHLYLRGFKKEDHVSYLQIEHGQFDPESSGAEEEFQETSVFMARNSATDLSPKYRSKNIVDVLAFCGIRKFSPVVEDTTNEEE